MAVKEKKIGSKRFDALKKANTENSAYNVEDVFAKVKENATAKFDETVEVSMNLNLMAKHTVRDTMSFPHSFGKEKVVLVFAKGDDAETAKSAGADYVGADELVEKIQGGWVDFDVAIASPDMMKDVGKLGPVLGRRGLMPNPKTGTVTKDIDSAVKAFKAGRVEFRADKNGVVNMGVGKASMDVAKLKENFIAFYKEVMKKKPTDLKGDYIQSVDVSSTMGVGLRIDHKKMKV